MDYQKITEYRNERSPYVKRSGIVVEEIREGYARAVKTIQPEDTNHLGGAHGAVLFALADTACGSAAASHGYKAVTLNASYNFLHGCSAGDRITAQAQEIKRGSTVSVYEVLLTRQDGTAVGNASMSFYNLKQPLEL